MYIKTTKKMNWSVINNPLLTRATLSVLNRSYLSLMIFWGDCTTLFLFKRVQLKKYINKAY